MQEKGGGIMDTQNLVVGSRIEHGLYGSGVVTFVGTDYIGIAFDNAKEALIRRESLEKDEPDDTAAQEPDRETLPWPASTFVFEGEDVEHSLGSHWRAFADDVPEWFRCLPEVIANAELQEGYGDLRKPTRLLPDDWPKGRVLVWPKYEQGAAMVVRLGQENNTLVSIFPFFNQGSQHTVVLREVNVWESGVEAQVTVSLGEGEVTFFDTRYPMNRDWYETGKACDFILAGIAYEAAPAERSEFQVNRHPDEVAWTNQRLQDGEQPLAATCTVSLEGAAILMPVSEWDVDDYNFRAPVKSVTAFTDWLGQDGWRVRATVMRIGDEDVDLDILVTRRAWEGEAPPQVGQDIEGLLWLQGYLWSPYPTE